MTILDMPLTTPTTPDLTVQIPSIPLKEMDSAMLSFELVREIDRIFGSEKQSAADQQAARNMVLSAAMVATHLHRNQTRYVRENFPRVPYIEHPLRNTLRLIRWGARSADLLAASVLHDTVEDCAAEIVGVYFFDLGEKNSTFTRASAQHQSPAQDAVNQRSALRWISRAYSPATAFIVAGVTNPIDGGTYLGHLRELASPNDTVTRDQNRDPLLVKAADLIDNAGSLAHQYGQVPNTFIEKMVRKYAPAVLLVKRALSDLAFDESLNLNLEAIHNPEIKAALAAVDALDLLSAQLDALAVRLGIDLAA
jgi:hypothetical protein